MAGTTGYILAFAMLIAAGIVGVVVMPAERKWEVSPREAEERWFSPDAQHA